MKACFHSLALFALLAAACSPSPQNVSTDPRQRAETKEKDKNAKVEKPAYISIQLLNEPEIIADMREKLTGYHMVVMPREGSTCENATIYEKVAAWDKRNFKAEVQANCSYSVGLQLGQLDTTGTTLAQVAYSNIAPGQKGWPVFATELPDGFDFVLSKVLTKAPVGGSPSPSTPSPAPSPNPEPIDQSIPSKQLREVAAFHLNNNLEGKQGKSSIETNGHQMDILSPLWYFIDASGAILLKDDGMKSDIVSAAQSKNIRIVPSIENKDGTTGFLSASLAVDTISSLVSNNNFAGIHLNFTRIPVVQKDQLASFITKLADKLHANQKLLTITIPPTDGIPGEDQSAYDLATLAIKADRVVLRLHDMNNATTVAGPIAPIGWVEANIKHALTYSIPPEKLSITIPTYGYEWLDAGGATQMSQGKIYAYLAQNGGVDNSPYFCWVDLYQVPRWAMPDRTFYVENEYAASAKFDLANKYNIKGVYVWSIGIEQPEFWQRVNAKFTKATSFTKLLEVTSCNGT